MRKIFACCLLVLASTLIQAQSGASYGVSYTSLSTNSAGAVTGTPFALPTTYASLISWQLNTDGGSVSIQLEGSNDNTTWSTIDSTVIAGLKNYGFTAIKFIRCSQTSRTGGTFTNCTFVVNRGYINNTGFNSGTAINAPNGSNNSPSYSFVGAPTSGFYRDVNNGFTGYTEATTLRIGFGASSIGIALANGNPLSFSSTNGAISNATIDAQVWRQAPDTLAMSRAGNPTAFRYYNTTDSNTAPANYERMTIGAWSTNNFAIGTENAGTGTVRGFGVNIGGVSKWIFNSSGNFVATTDNASDIGASGANRPRAIYAATSINTGTQLNFTTSTAFGILPADANGVMRYCNDCTKNTNPCTGGGTGTLAMRLNGAWVCF